ncbi:hypothetical protein E2C01_023222 [Portunus trituberculatus]|uniref:Uncharacterized protein n=1 Tax=Portunus trituberculatus TaxID=210409 RepID=A0A5B7E886_PORTR|nr:hypothetical protein [Portunus trituberculatus]
MAVSVTLVMRQSSEANQQARTSKTPVHMLAKQQNWALLGKDRCCVVGERRRVQVRSANIDLCRVIP